jgi:hypothetical protein
LRLFFTGVLESRNVKRRNPETGTSIGVSDTGSWRSQESRLFITGVPESRNVKCRNPETGTSTGVLDTGSWRSQESRLFITGVPKSRNAKRRNTFWCRFRIPGVGVSKHFITRNVGMPKCEMHVQNWPLVITYGHIVEEM